MPDSMWRIYAERVAAVKKQLQAICEDTETLGFQPHAETIEQLRTDFSEAKAMLWSVCDDLHAIARHHESLMRQHHLSDDFVLKDAEGGVLE